MVALSFFSWWYGKGWIEVVKSLAKRVAATRDEFSVTQLLRTLFAPWRRIITNPGRSLDEKFRAWADNAFSRVIGFIVRLFVLLAAVIGMALVAILTVIEIVIWPLLPLAIPSCLIAGLLTL